jgi:hypothetical protein
MSHDKFENYSEEKIEQRLGALLVLACGLTILFTVFYLFG